MLELFVAADQVRRAMRDAIELDASSPTGRRRQRTRLRSGSAARLRSLADRLEPSATPRAAPPRRARATSR